MLNTESPSTVVVTDTVSVKSRPWRRNFDPRPYKQQTSTRRCPCPTPFTLLNRIKHTYARRLPSFISSPDSEYKYEAGDGIWNVRDAFEPPRTTPDCRSLVEQHHTEATVRNETDGNTSILSTNPHVKTPELSDPTSIATRRVHFAPNIRVSTIPSHRSFTKEEKLLIWTSPRSIREKAKISVKEWKFEGCNYRTALEEECFLSDAHGNLWHPVHWRFSSTQAV